MPKSVLIDLRGQVFGRLTVTGRAANTSDGKARWYCKCECGRYGEFPVRGEDLRRGNTKSCGCYKRDQLITANRKRRK